MNDGGVAALAGVFAQSLSPNQAEIKQAEQYLRNATTQGGYTITVLKLVAADNAPPEVRQAAAVNFKNTVKAAWVARETNGLSVTRTTAIPDAEKEQIRGLITGLMLSTPPLVRAQLSEALTLISGHDFPAAWPQLLPELLEKMGSTDPAVVNGVLQTANSIFKRYRNQFMTDALSKELEYCQALVKPLLAALRSLTQQAGAAVAAGQLDAARLALGSARLACRVFYSLNSPGLTEEFEGTLDGWMAEFHTLLTLEAPALTETDPEKETVPDAVKGAVCANINLFLEMNEEEFAKYLGTFVQDVWTLLTKVTLEPRQDHLAMNAIRFLTTVSRGVHHVLFKDAAALRQVCENIVVPNLRLREDVEEMFDMNWVEYVRRDTEGSDNDTRRRAACELVRSLTDKFPAEVTQLFTGYVGTMLAEYAANPAANWKSKDCATYLVVALTVRGRTAAQGATTTNELVNIMDFFRQQVLPDLQAPNVDDQGILKADALRFTTTFRSQIPKPELLAVFPAIINLLRSDSNVVHSYAAVCIERLLSMKEHGQQRFAVAELSPMLQALLTNLFGAFSKPESGENEYLMKCVMRVIIFVGPQIAPVAATALAALAQMLLAVCKNPTQPGFNHFLFESVAALIRYASQADPTMIKPLEEGLFPAFQVVLAEDVQEFHPYVFQIFAQLIETRPAPLPVTYMQIFPPLLSPVFWERSGNVPALVRLLQAYLDKAPAEVVSSGSVAGMLGVFQKLLASKAHDHEGFALLGAVMEHLPPDTFAQYLPTIWQVIFQRLQSARTNKYVRGMVVFMAHFIAMRRVITVAASVDSVQPGLFVMILQNVWVAGMGGGGATDHETKLVAVATTQLLTELPALQEPANAALWGQLLEAVLRLLGGRADGSAGSEEEVADLEDFTGYSAAYARLHNADHAKGDPLPAIPDAMQYLAQALVRASAAHPGRLPGLVSGLAPELQQQLQVYCQAAGVSIA